jgi:hypothetical protein
MTKTEKVLLHLLEYKEIDTWTAIKKYKATRLSAIIFNLKDKGHLIISEVHRKLKNGNEWWVVYRYKGFKKLN